MMENLTGMVSSWNISGTGVTVYELFLFILIIVVSFALGQIISKKLRKDISGKIPVNDRELLIKIVYFTILTVGLITALPYIDVDLSGILFAGGIIGIIIGFAGQNLFSNFISGIVIFIERPIKIGDNVGVGDVLGTVEDIRILSTIIKTYDGIYTRIPNLTIFSSNITNYVANVARRFEYSVEIRYRDDAELAMSVIKGVIDSHPFALKYPKPVVFVDRLGQNGVVIIVKIWAPSSVWWDVRRELLQKIKLAVEAEGVEIPFPQRTVWFPEKNPVFSEK
ncbi:mechanosensitive ion channel family protein [Methanoplanus endosymbiosus]|uniref:Mechanosensitive ion channel family protein n=1 Tax=Methanoplanus endosymbiosus TaxID=33865 RepID=A0A9E7PN35_9EURY|nr:mechanosensitive ion channel family protein [Methanoplanus endosymbiosus]UUX91716.1 mechanosensitive ion channel family protein [Methanoplanus endosymbiosus]